MSPRSGFFGDWTASRCCGCAGIEGRVANMDFVIDFVAANMDCGGGGTPAITGTGSGLSGVALGSKVGLPSIRPAEPYDWSYDWSRRAA